MWLAVGLGRLFRSLIGLARPLLRLCQIEHAQQLLGKHKVLGAKDLIGAGIIEVGENDLGFREQLAVEQDLGGDDGPFTPQVREGDLINELVPAQATP